MTGEQTYVYDMAALQTLKVQHAKRNIAILEYVCLSFVQMLQLPVSIVRLGGYFGSA